MASRRIRRWDESRPPIFVDDRARPLNAGLAAAYRMEGTMIETSTNPSPHPAVTLLGAGTMGTAMAQRLLDLGFRVDVWNRTPTQVTALTQHGATASTKPAEAVAAADVVVTM